MLSKVQQYEYMRRRESSTRWRILGLAWQSGIFLIQVWLKGTIVAHFFVSVCGKEKRGIQKGYELIILTRGTFLTIILIFENL